MPSNVYVLSTPARTADNCRSLAMLGSASARICRSMPSTTSATKTPMQTRSPVRSSEYEAFLMDRPIIEQHAETGLERFRLHVDGCPAFLAQCLSVIVLWSEGA